MIKGYDNKLEEPAANVTTIVKAAFTDWMNCHGVARSTILLGMELRIQAEFTVIEDAKTPWEKVASAYKSKLKLNIFEIRGIPLEHQATGLRRCRQLHIMDQLESQRLQSLHWAIDH